MSDTLLLDRPKPAGGSSRYKRPNEEPSVAAVEARYYQSEESNNDEFTEYELHNFPDWDGAGAEPITIGTVAAARRVRRLLPRRVMPHIAAGADGTIGFQWETGGSQDGVINFIEIGPDDQIKASRFHADGRVEAWERGRVGVRQYANLIWLFPDNE
jgi:hypothetical protein